MRTRVVTEADRRRSRRLFHKVLELLRAGDWRIRFARLGEDARLRDKFSISACTIGLCDHESEVLYVDYRKELLPILVHECLHAIYPEKDEAAILELEDATMLCLSPKQAAQLIGYINLLD